MAEKILDMDELYEVDMGSVDAKVNRTLRGGRYLFEAKTAEVTQGEDKEGNDRLVLSFRSEVIQVISLDDKTLDEEDYVAQSAFERFYKPTTENIGYVKAYANNVMGADVEMSFKDMLKYLNGEGEQPIRFIARINERTYQGNPQANLSREPKDFIGFEKLDEKYLAK